MTNPDEASFRTPQDLLEYVQQDRQLAPDQILRLCKQFHAETEWHDFKSGQVGQQDKPGRRIRDYVASFANSAGGVLFIGIAERTAEDGKRTYEVDGLSLKPSQTAEDYVANHLQHEYSQYSPPPKLGKCSFPDGRTVALSRSLLKFEAATRWISMRLRPSQQLPRWGRPLPEAPLRVATSLHDLAFFGTHDCVRRGPCRPIAATSFHLATV